MHRMFVYGTLKSGFWNHRLLIGSKAIGRAQSVNPYTVSDVGFPCAKPATGEPLRGTLFGEVYEVNDETLARLDRLEGNGSMYIRAERPFWVDGHDAPQTLWVYEWNGAHRGRPVPPDANGAINWRDEQRPEDDPLIFEPRDDDLVDQDDDDALQDGA